MQERVLDPDLGRAVGCHRAGPAGDPPPGRLIRDVERHGALRDHHGQVDHITRVGRRGEPATPAERAGEHRVRVVRGMAVDTRHRDPDPVSVRAGCAETDPERGCAGTVNVADTLRYEPVASYPANVASVVRPVARANAGAAVARPATSAIAAQTVTRPLIRPLPTRLTDQASQTIGAPSTAAGG